MLLRRPMIWVVLILLAPVLRAQEQAFPKADAPRGALKNLIVYPAQITLEGPRDEQRIGVLGEYADGRAWDLSRETAVVSSDSRIALVDSGVVRPVADGQATLTVTAAG